MLSLSAPSSKTDLSLAHGCRFVGGELKDMDWILSSRLNLIGVQLQPLQSKEVVNPTYYGLEDTETKTLNSYLSRLMQTTFQGLEDSGCIKMDEDSVEPLMLGTIASPYYLSNMIVLMFGSYIDLDTSLEVFLYILSGASVYDELPVRHNEVK